MIDNREIAYGAGSTISIQFKIVNNSNAALSITNEIVIYLTNPDVEGNYYGVVNGQPYTGAYGRFPDGARLTFTNSVITINQGSSTEYFNLTLKKDGTDQDSANWLADRGFVPADLCSHGTVTLYKTDGSGEDITHNTGLKISVTSDESYSCTINFAGAGARECVKIVNGGKYTLTITGDSSSSGDSDSEGDSGGNSSSTNGQDYDNYTNYPTVATTGWETYHKGKRAELMYASIIPGCTDSCFFMTKYFEFGGITNKPVTLYYITDNPSESTAKRYVFYEISEDDYNNGINGSDKEHFYRIDGVFGGLGLTNNYSFSGGTRNGKIDEHQYLGTTSEPDYIGNYVSSINTDSNYSPLYKILLIAQEVGDSSAREPTKGLNHGRVRPLGNTDTSKGYRQPNNPIGNPFNGFSINTLKARFTDNTAQFKSSISSDEVHADGPTSWPSGHSSQCWAMAMVIVQLYGLKYNNSTNNSSQQEKIISTICKYVHKAYKFGVLRTIGRFHWNSDTMYGKIFGSMIMPILNSSYDSNSGAPESFNELFDAAAAELFPGETLTRIDSIPIIDSNEIENDPYKSWFPDFKELINKIGSDTNIGVPTLNDQNIGESIFGYLWYMYKAGRTEIESNSPGKVFDFFNDNNTQFYPNDDDNHYFDDNNDDIIENWDNPGYRSWFPEVFPKNHSQSLKLLQEGSETTITYHGNNSSYYKNGDYRANISGLTRSKILCSWLMAFCLSELYVSKANKGDTSIQTKIFNSAYNIGGGRELNFYDEYNTGYDPVYLRLAAGIIYCFNRGKFNHQTIYNLGNKGGPQLDSNSDNTIEPKEANTQVGNDIDKGLRSESGAWAQATVNYGVDNYFIFPNAPGPYVPGRQFSKPFEKNSYKPGDYSKVQGETQFIVPGVKIVDPNNGGSGSSSSGIVYTGYESPIITSFIPNDSSSNSPEGEKLYSVGLISDLHLNYQENFDSTQTDAEGLYYDEDDLAKILQIFKEKNVEFVCGCGDITESGQYYQDHIDANNIYENDGYKIPLLSKSAPHYAIDDDAQNFYNIYTKYSNGLKFYTPLGNHDFLGLFEALKTDIINPGNTANEYANGDDNKGFNESVHDRIKDIWFKYIHCPEVIGSNENIHYFRYNNNNGPSNLSGWQYGTAGSENYYSKLNFWFEKELSNGKKDRYVFMSIDYGNDKFKGGNGDHDWHDRKINAREIIPYNENDLSQNDIYVNKIFELIGTDYDDSHAKYNYQFYHPNVLIWLYEILFYSENDDSINNVYVFSHHFLPHKVGNNIAEKLPNAGFWGYGSAYSSDEKDTNKRNLSANISENHDGTAEFLNIGNESLNIGATYLTGIEFLFINYLNNTYKKSIFFSGHSHISWKNENSEASHITYGKDYVFISPNDANNKRKYTKSANPPENVKNVNGGKWVALPSACKPAYGNEKDRQPNNGYAGSHRDEAEFTIMDVYSNGVQLSGYNMVRTENTTNDEGGGTPGTITIKLTNSTNNEIRLCGEAIMNISQNPTDTEWSNTKGIDVHLVSSHSTGWKNEANDIVIPAGGTKSWSYEIDSKYFDGTYYIMEVDHGYGYPLYLYSKYYSKNSNAVKQGNGMYHTKTTHQKLQSGGTISVTVDRLKDDAMLADNNTTISTIPSDKNYAILIPGTLTLAP